MRYRETISSRSTGRHGVCINFSSDVRHKIILDIGCWIGWYEKYVANKCELIIGIDIDSKALLNAKKNVDSINCEFICSSASKLPFKPNSFDLISMFDVIEHLPMDLENESLSDINRVLYPNSELLVSTPNNNLLSILLDPAYFLLGHRHYSNTKISEMLMVNGFKVKDIKYGGGIIESISMILLYLFKHLFGLEIPFKKSLDSLREKEYNGKGFVTLFVKAIKTEDAVIMDEIP